VRLGMRNMTFVSTSSELAYLAYQSTAFNSPVPYLSQQATFARTDLGLTSYAVSGGVGRAEGAGTGSSMWVGWWAGQGWYCRAGGVTGQVAGQVAGQAGGAGGGGSQQHVGGAGWV
jgi:hypothetical protein